MTSQAERHADRERCQDDTDGEQRGVRDKLDRCIEPRSERASASAESALTTRYASGSIAARPTTAAAATRSIGAR